MRYDLAFFLCCCKSFLGSDSKGSESDFYGLLGVERDATADDIKRAYKRRSLEMHPDKLAQRGKVATEEDQAKFTRMKEAYEVLSDTHKRETYDAIGERGMKWLEEPFSIDLQEMAHNFATSSVMDRSKIFGIFVAIAVVVFLLPILVCLQIDQVFGPHASWFAVLVPLWLWDAFIVFYHSRVIMMGPIPRPEHIPESEWVDPLPMKKRIFSLIRFILIVMFEILMAAKLDGLFGDVYWSVIFFPLYIWEATTLYKKWPLARMRIVTVEDLESALGKPFAEFTQAEKDLIGKRYSVVPSTTSPEFDAAQKLKTRARHDMVKSAFRIAFCVAILLKIDNIVDWSWWLIFFPFWFITALICYANYQAFSEVSQMAAEKLQPHDLEYGKTSPSTNYGAVGANGDATAHAANEAANKASAELSEEEREEVKAQLLAGYSRLCSKCCSQGFLLLIVLLLLGKLEGADYSSVWIISPLLFMAGFILFCLGYAIFAITEVPTDGVEFDMNELAESNVGESPTHSSAAYVPPKPETITPIGPVDPTPTSVPIASAEVEVSQPATAPKSVWDPEKGEIWIETEPPGVAPIAEEFPPSAHPPSPARSVDPPARLIRAQQTKTQQSVNLLDDTRGRGYQDPPAPNASFSGLD